MILDKCTIVLREFMYDVYINGKFVGKGQRHYMNTAYYFYKEQGFDLEVLHG